MLGGWSDVHDVKIRLAVPSDAAALASLTEELGYSASPAEIAERLLALSSSSTDAVFVAVVGLTAVAWIHVAAVTLLESSRHAEIRGLVVTSSLRARGIGAQLVAHAEAWARAQGLSRIRVRSNAVRVETHRFYERLGYGVKKEQKVFDKGL